MQNLIETFKRIGGLSQRNQEALLGVIQRIECTPKTLLQELDTVCDSIYFIEKGLARTFYYKDGKDITYWIALENDFVGSMASFFMRVPSNKMVETLEPSVLWKFDYSKMESLFSSNQEMQKVGRLFAYYGISIMEKRFDDLHFHTAKERYEFLVKNKPELLQRMSLGMIATYLGITQETLSRIRKKK